jgi:hypothetical protein
MNQILISGRHAALVAVVPVIIYTFIAGMGGRGAVGDPGPFFLLALLLDREKDLDDA